MAKRLKGAGIEPASERDVSMSAVRLIYNRNPTVKAIFDALANPAENALNRTNGTWSVVDATVVDDAVAVTNCGRAEIVEALKKLAKCGCGRFLSGRRGKRTRFNWRFSDAIAFAKEVIEKPELLAVDVAARDSKIEFVEQPIWLRPTVQVTVRFPQDMTKEEAEKVAGVVRHLWLGTAAPE